MSGQIFQVTSFRPDAIVLAHSFLFFATSLLLLCRTVVSSIVLVGLLVTGQAQAAGFSITKQDSKEKAWGPLNWSPCLPFAGHFEWLININYCRSKARALRMKEKVAKARESGGFVQWLGTEAANIDDWFTLVMQYAIEYMMQGFIAIASCLSHFLIS